MSYAESFLLSSQPLIPVTLAASASSARLNKPLGRDVMIRARAAIITRWPLASPFSFLMVFSIVFFPFFRFLYIFKKSLRVGSVKMGIKKVRGFSSHFSYGCYLSV